ncbi:MAG TPA: hypothetical protein ENN41_10495 [Sediminispirochaeta sp.]|nr:hypothetical protein [Sediminispirochaeta sp.]
MDEHGAHREYTQWFYEYWKPTYLAEMQDFVDCIAEDRPPRVGLEDGYRAVQWAFVAAEAVRKGTVIRMK